MKRPGAAFRFSCAVVLSFAAALAPGLPGAWTALALSALLCLALRPSREELLPRLSGANLFLLFLWLVTPLSTPGEALASAGPFTVTAEGLRLSLLVTVKCNAVILALSACLAAMTLAQAAEALTRLRLPGKLVLLLLFTGRYISSLRREYARLRDAARLRGFRPRTSLYTYRVYAAFTGQLFVRAFDRAQRTAEAMLLRGFDGEHLLFLAAPEPPAGIPEALLAAFTIFYACAVAAASALC